MNIAPDFQPALLAGLSGDLSDPIDVPPGFSTVWSWTARNEPHVLDLMLDPIAGMIDEDDRARIIAERCGDLVVEVIAPEAVRAAGRDTIGVFSEATLRELVGTTV